MAISFIHTADLQIGKGFESMGKETAVLLKRERISAVRRIAELASERKVEAVLVAGDAFDFDTVSNETVHSWLQAMTPYSGPWVVIPGNHDAAIPESVWQRVTSLGPPANLRISLEPEVLLLADERLAVMTAPLRRRHETEDVTSAWDGLTTLATSVRIGLAHGAVTAYAPSGEDAMNPIPGDREERSKLDYLALGDWHGTMQVGQRSWYSGTPETDRFKGNDSGNVLLVTIDGPGAVPNVEKIRVGRFRWHEFQCSVNTREDLASLEATLRAVGDPFDDAVVDLTIAGTVDLETRGKLECLLEGWRGRLLCLRLHCEKLIAQPTDADLDRIDTGGFVRSALERLRRAQSEPTNPDQSLAADAIALLHRVHTGVVAL